jgi:hypothetical protein
VAATRDSSLRGASRPPGGPIPSHVRRLAHALCWIAPEPSVNDKDSGLRSFLNRNDFFADCNPHTDGLPQAREGISTCRSRTRGSREERDYRGKGAQTPLCPSPLSGRHCWSCWSKYNTARHPFLRLRTPFRSFWRRP